MEAEGYKKFGLIYRLIETGYLEKGSTILWDEPEANLNPKMIPEIVRILLALSRHGVQVFFATHDYNFIYMSVLLL
jgi:ABC-type ATPase involved in cell division